MFQVEYAIAKILKQGMALFREDTEMLDAIFNFNEIEEFFDIEAIEGFRRLILNNRIAVRMGWPKDEAAFPCFSIIVASIAETNRMQGDVMRREIETRDGSTYEMTYKGAYYQCAYKVSSWSTNTELTLLLFYLSHYLMFANKGFLHVAGVVDVSLSGYDMEFAEQFSPEFVYTRPLIVTTQVPMEFRAAKKEAMAVNKLELVI